MAPRTRHSHITTTTTDDHTGEASNAKDLVAQGPRHTSTPTENNAEHQNNIAKVPESRVCASRSKIGTVRLLLMMTSTRETHLCFKHPIVLPETQAIPTSQVTQVSGYSAKQLRTSGK